MAVYCTKCKPMNSPSEALFAVPSKLPQCVGAALPLSAGSWQSWTQLSATEGPLWQQCEAPPPAPAQVLSLLGLSKCTKLTFKSWIHSPGQLLTRQLQCYLTLASSRFRGSSETHCPPAELPLILHPQIWIPRATFSDSQANATLVLYSTLYMLWSWPIFSALFPNPLCKQCQNLVLGTNNIFWK